MYGGGIGAKPSGRTAVDPFHPLSTGLVWAAPLTEGGGRRSAGYGGADLTIVSGTAWANGPTPVSGPGLQCAGTPGLGATVPAPPWLQLQCPFSMVVGFRRLGAPGNSSSCLLTLALNNNFTGNFYTGNIAYSVATQNLVLQTQSTQSSSTILTPTTGVDYIVVGVFGASTYAAYCCPVGGQATITTGSWVTSTQTFAATAELILGSVSLGRDPNANIWKADVYNRPLAQQEALSICYNPWQMYGQPAWFYGTGSVTIVAFPRNPLVVKQVRQQLRTQKPIQAKSPGGNPTVRPRSPAVSLARLPAQTVRLILIRAKYASPQVGFPARYFPIPPGKPVRPTQAICLHSKYSAPITNPYPPRYFPIPYRKPTRGGWPLFLRQSIPGSSPPVVPPIGFNLGAWSAVMLSSDSDPLAVDFEHAVIVD